MMFCNKKNAQKVSKFKRNKCDNCKICFPAKKAIHIQKENKNEICCSPKCLPEGDYEILNCSTCNELVLNDSIFCSSCNRWVHQLCAKLNDNDIFILGSSDIDWMCFSCTKIHFHSYLKMTVQLSSNQSLNLLIGLITKNAIIAKVKQCKKIVSGHTTTIR